MELRKFDSQHVRVKVMQWILDGYAFPEGWTKLRAIRALAQTTDRELRGMWSHASRHAVTDPPLPRRLPVGPPENAKAWNVARALGELRTR